MKALLLTLGHNSSAILIEDNKVVWGYETERISGLKSDSRFPMPFIEKYLGKRPEFDVVYVTHWATDGVLSSMSAKHWDPSYFDGKPIRTLSIDRSHHDTHMSAAMCYAGKEFFKHKHSVHGLIIDGFGTLGEHLSIYDLSDGTPKLIKRIHGYETSLGLWYQYATAFMGMKMHEDEYKLLGYETHCHGPIGDQLIHEADLYALEWIDKLGKSIYKSIYDPMYSLDALGAVKTNVFKHLAKVCRQYNLADPTESVARSILALYVQRVLESVVLNLIGHYNMKNVILSGGCFYNVKLNKRIIDEIDGQVCIYPLAGDQGNALGLYAMDHPEFIFPDNLNWGIRKLKNVGEIRGIFYADSYDEATEMITSSLAHHGYVNLVRGAMEFGPRAMCNTSTLAIPTMDVVQSINTMNNRNTVMPMAPVMTEYMYKTMFERTSQVWRSQHHMITALEYVEYPPSHLLGIAHEYLMPHHHHTGRPQVTHDPFMVKILDHIGHPLINTSFNYHGMPIALGMEEVISNHRMQQQREPSISTVVITNA